MARLNYESPAFRRTSLLMRGLKMVAFLSVYETEGYWFESSGVYFRKAASSHPLTRLFS